MDLANITEKLVPVEQMLKGAAGIWIRPARFKSKDRYSNEIPHHLPRQLSTAKGIYF